MARRSRFFVYAAALVALALLAGGLWYALRSGPAAITASLAPDSGLLHAPPAEGFKRVTGARAFQFPQDHGPHRDYQTEWWYYTGNLADANGRRFGYQLTFFRQGLASQPISRTSEWSASEAYMAHFTLTDAQSGTFYAFDRLARGGEIGLAGAADPYRIFIEGWSAAGTGDDVTLRAESDGISITLDLASLKPPTLQGDAGFSQKSSEAGNASYYYSFTHMDSSGSMNIQGQSYQVTGLSWFDHEWSTSALGQGQTGWDWFGLHLGDGRDLMWGQLRRSDGTIDVAHGSMTASVNQGGAVSQLNKGDVTVTVLDTWQSPSGEARYPSRWRIAIPSQGVEIELTPLVADQELRLQTSTYWEGAVQIQGTVDGYGYVEMTGYSAKKNTRQVR